MAKNPNNRYFDVGLAKDSWVLEQVLDDAEMHQMGDQPAKLIALRLTEYYRLVQKGIVIPGVTVLAKTSQETEIPVLQDSSALPTKKQNGDREAKGAPLIDESDRVGSNASLALSFFKDDEE